MKKFKFRLESVLKVRTLHKRLAERDLAETQSHINRNREEMHKVEHAVEQSYRQDLNSAANPAFMQEVVFRHRRGLEQRKLQLEEKQRELDEELEGRKKVLTARMRDEMVMEKLEEYQKQEYLREADAVQQAEMEEIDILKRGGVS